MVECFGGRVVRHTMEQQRTHFSKVRYIHGNQDNGQDQIVLVQSIEEANQAPYRN